MTFNNPDNQSNYYNGARYVLFASKKEGLFKKVSCFVIFFDNSLIIDHLSEDRINSIKSACQKTYGIIAVESTGDKIFHDLIPSYFQIDKNSILQWDARNIELPYQIINNVTYKPATLEENNIPIRINIQSEIFMNDIKMGYDYGMYAQLGKLVLNLGKQKITFTHDMTTIGVATHFIDLLFREKAVIEPIEDIITDEADIIAILNKSRDSGIEETYTDDNIKHILYGRYKIGRARITMHTYVIFYDNYYLKAVIDDSAFITMKKILLHRGNIPAKSLSGDNIYYECIPLLYENSKSEILAMCNDAESIEVPYKEIDKLSISFADADNNTFYNNSSSMDINNCAYGYNRPSYRGYLNIETNEDGYYEDFGVSIRHSMTAAGTTAQFLNTYLKDKWK